MILDIPFVRQENSNECFIASAKTVLNYFNNNISYEELKKVIYQEPAGVIWSINVVKGIAELGYKVEFYTNSLTLRKDNYDLEFYKKNADTIDKTIEKLEKAKTESKKFGAILKEETLSLEGLLNKINENCIPIMLLEWGVVVNKPEKNSIHAIPIIGYDDKYVYINEVGDENGKDFRIEREIFDRARKAPGTDEDIIFIYRK